MLKDCPVRLLDTVIPMMDVAAGSEGFSAEPSSAVTRYACHSAPMPRIMHAAFAVTRRQCGYEFTLVAAGGFTAT